MRIENIGGKIIGIGDVTVLPGETKDVPKAYETSPILEVYRGLGMARITGGVSVPAKTAEQIAAEKADAEKKAAEDAEALRLARLASLDGISEEDLGKLADELGINMASCKDQADVLKKVKAALKR